jgi:acetyl-CoA carboxylase biotin carboxylase subunit
VFDTILIANRGEIAVRIARTCREMGISVVAVHSTQDSDSAVVRMADRAVCIGPAPAKHSYLHPAGIMEAAARTGAQAIHPGYGFLSEDPDFVELCEAHGVAFIGPPAPVMAALGDKSSAREIMTGAGLPLLPGSVRAIDDVREARATADRIGYPVIIKATAGGGGRGMRIVRRAADLDEAFRNTRATAAAIFNDSRVYLERYLVDTRHVEVQILADQHGNAVHLGERDCTVQRRHQKLIEETPAPGLSARTAADLHAAAIRGALVSGYVGAGTFEFLVDGRGEFYFMEVNCRIQVEHPVTEMVSGVDLVEEQIRVAAGEPLRMRQEDIRLHGVAIECRVNAEDPARDFAPAPGVLEEFDPPGGPFVRVDTYGRAGGTVSPNYDSLLAKAVVWAPDRERAIDRMRRALGEFRVSGPGVRTTTGFLRDVLDHPRFRGNRHTTALVDSILSETDAQKESGMPQITETTKILTLINTFSVEPENQEKLMEILDEATRDVMCHFPGFISASLHASHDKKRVANYAQWRCEEDFLAAIRHPDFLPHFTACETIATADPRLYWVYATQEAE